MGIEYSLANPNYKTLFELGKGSWSSVFSRVGKYDYKSIEEYIEALAKEIFFEIWWGHDEESDDLSYQRHIARKIVEFMDGESFYGPIVWGEGAPLLKGICLVNDSDDSEYELKYHNQYVYIGSRYHLDDPISYADNISAINALHGVSNPRISRDVIDRYAIPNKSIKDYHRILVLT